MLQLRKRLERNIVLLFIVMGLFTLIVEPPWRDTFAWAKTNSFRIEWEKVWEGEGNTLTAEPQTVALAPGGNILVGGVSRKKSRNMKLRKENLWIWKLNRQGKRVQVMEFKNLLEEHKLMYPNIDALIPLPFGEILFVMQDSYASGLYLVKVDQSGKVLFVKKIMRDDQSPVKMVSASKDKIFLFGAESDAEGDAVDAWVGQIDIRGTLLWEKVFNRIDTPEVILGKSPVKMETFLDAFPLEDGGAILVGNAGGYLGWLSPCNVWLIRINAKGDILREVVFPGRQGHMVRGPDDSYVLVYETNTLRSPNEPFQQTIWVQAFTQKLDSLWKSEITTFPEGLGRFMIAPFSNKGFIITGNDHQDNLRVWRLSLKGEKMWDVNGNQKSLNFQLIPSDDQFFMVFEKSVSTEVEDRHVGAFKFIVRE